MSMWTVIKTMKKSNFVFMLSYESLLWNINIFKRLQKYLAFVPAKTTVFSI